MVAMAERPPASVPTLKLWLSVFCGKCGKARRTVIVGKVSEDHQPETSEFRCRHCGTFQVV